MGKVTIWQSDLPDAKGNFSQVPNQDELQKIFVGVGGDVFQLDVTEGEAQAFLKSVQKYVDASKKAHVPDSNDPDDLKMFEGVFDTKKGYRKTSYSPGAARTAGTAGTSAPNKSALTGAQLAGLVDGLVWTEKAVGKGWGPKNIAAGDEVQSESKGFKSFVEAMGADAGTTRIPNDSFWEAIQKAQADGFIAKKGEDSDKSED